MLNLLSPLDLAEGWGELPIPDRVIAFKLLSRRRAIVLFESLDVEDQASLLQALEGDRAPKPGAGEPQQGAFAFAPPDLPASAPDGGAPVGPEPELVSAFLRSLSGRTLAKLNRHLAKEGAALAIPLASWPAGTVGSMMHPPSTPLDAGL